MKGTVAPFAFCLLVGLVMGAVPCAVANDVDPPGIAKARAAANDGDARAAIQIYDTLLQASPDDVTLLNESAQQLSWSGRYDEAIARYDRVLALDPQNRFAKLELAKVLSWSGRYDDAAAAFRKLLAEDPADVAAHLGLARSLSWSGQQGAARQEFQAILSAHPGNTEAMLGIARTYAWSGQLAEARVRYEEVASLVAEPREADIGLAYLDLWEGNVAAAWAAAERLSQRYPDDREVAELRRAIRRTKTPWFAAGWDQMDDTDRNQLTALRVEVNARLLNGVGVGLGYAAYDVYTAGARGSIDSLQARADWSPRRGHRLEAMLGRDRLDQPGQPGQDVSDWGLAWSFPLSAGWSGRLDARREPYRYSVPLIENRIVVDSLTVGIDGSIGDHWLVGGNVVGWDVSDGNRRLAADSYARRRWLAGRHTLEGGVVARWLDWQHDLDNGYFDPSSFLALGATARAFGPLGRGAPVNYDVFLETGLQSFDVEGQRTRNDPYYLVVARLGWEVSTTLRLEVFAEAGSYASEGAADWRYTRAGARIVWRPGEGRK